jgi:hypothetical protein
MSFDEGFLSELFEAIYQSGLRVIVVGDAAAILQGIPITMTQHVDLIVRKIARLKEKLELFAKRFWVTLRRPYKRPSRVVRAVGRPVGVDFLSALSSGKSFESIRSRASSVKIGRRTVLVASLGDIIAAKEPAGRPRE